MHSKFSVTNKQVWFDFLCISLFVWLVHHFFVMWKEGFSLKNALLFHLVSRPVVQKALGKKLDSTKRPVLHRTVFHFYVQLLCSKKTNLGAPSNLRAEPSIHLLNNVQIWNYEISKMIKFCWRVSMKSINTYTRVIHNKCIMHFWQAAYSAMKLMRGLPVKHEVTGKI